MSIATELRSIIACLDAPGDLTAYEQRRVVVTLQRIQDRVAALEAGLARARSTIDAIARDAAEDAALAELRGRQ